MLVDMAEENGFERWGPLQAAKKRARILQGDWIQTWITDRHRGMVQGQHHGLIGLCQLALEPVQLPGVKEARDSAAAVTREQQERPTPEVKGRRGDHSATSQGRSQQGRVVVVARGQGQGDLSQGLDGLKNLLQAAIAAPAFVLAEVPCDQQQIRGLIDLGQGLPQAVAQGGHGGTTSAVPPRVCQEVWITELKEARHTKRPEPWP